MCSCCASSKEPLATGVNLVSRVDSFVLRVIKIRCSIDHGLGLWSLGFRYKCNRVVKSPYVKVLEHHPSVSIY